MITETAAKKFGELSGNEEFMAAMAQAQTVEDIHKCLNANGVEISLEDVAEAYKAGKEQYESECSIDELDSVAGGYKFGDGIKTAANLTWGFCMVGVNICTGGKYINYLPRCKW